MEEVVKSTAMCEEDAAYVESFKSSVDCDQKEEAGDGIMGQMLTLVQLHFPVIITSSN